jgi:uncharacterized phage protein gp47/JayE
MSGLEATGWVPKTVAEIREEIVADLRDALGTDVDVSAESVLGELVAVQATKLGELWELVGAIYAARTPSGASGAGLDALCEASPGIARAPATKGTVTLRVALTDATSLPAGSRAHVAGDPTNVWVTTATVTGFGVGSALYDVAAEALLAGRALAPAATITTIATPVSGWTSVTNVLDADPGTETETDAPLRVRRAQSLQRNASSPVEAIAAQVAEVSGVTQVTAWENATDYTDAEGRPPHSVEVLALGGTDEAVARAVWAAKAAGIASFGSTSVTFTDARGVSRTASFSRPTSLLMYATVEVEIDPAAYEGADAVKAAIVAATTSYRAGETALISDLVLAVRALPGVVDAYVWIGVLPALYTQARTNYTPTPRARCVFDTSRVVVTVR